jgi:cytochrome oxidase assembly protein ShyY1
MYRFLFSSKWLGYLLVAAIFAAACVWLGRWQMDRRNETLAEINRVTSNYSAAPAPFAEVRDQFTTLDPEREWTQVELRGSYDVSGQRIVRNRPLNGQPGYEVVVPLKLDSGETVVIDRGWLPIGNKTPGRPDSVPAPPQGQVTVVARLKPAEPQLQRGAPDGQLASIDLASYSAQLGYPVLTGAYGQLASERPSVPDMPFAFPKPATEEGTHRGHRCGGRRRGSRQRRLHALQRPGGPASSGPPEAEERDGGGRGRRHPGCPGLLKGAACTRSR